MRRLLLPTLLAPILAIGASTSSGGGHSTASGEGVAQRAKIGQSYGKLPLAFEPNRGQAGAGTAFLARGGGYSIALRPSEALFSLGKRDTLSMKIAGANEHATLVSTKQLPGKVNYLLGNDRSRWLTGLPTYARVTARNIYPGIDLAYYGRQGTLEYDFIVQPGTDPNRIAFGFEGARSLRLDRSGSLVIGLDTGAVRQPRPKIYQQIDGVRRAVEGRFDLRGSRVGFAIGRYDRTRTLVIDPQLVYSTYLGGSGFERGVAIAVDSALAVYVTGWTQSANFPTVGPYQGGSGGGTDAFVTKLNPAGNAFVYSTYLGGSDVEEGLSIAVDGSGAAYVTGHTISTNFPLANAIQSVQRGSYDLFVTKLDPSGSSLAYSTYLGGTGWDVFSQIAVDSSGSAYVVGETESTDFPLLNAFQSTHGVTQPGGFGADAFLTKFTPAGTAHVYSTFLGGNNTDAANGIAVDSTGAAYVSGAVRSLNFPTLNPYQAAKAGNPGQYDAFVTKFTPAGNALVYSTYLGGATSDGNPGIAVDSAGSAYVSASTTSPDFPTVNAYQANHGGIMDIYVTKFTPAGNALVYSTHLGGSGFDVAAGIAVDAAGSAYVGGYSDSPNYPAAGSCPRLSSGGQDAVVTKLSPTGIGLNYSTYLGGSNDEFAFGFAIDSAGAAYITGSTNSTNLPILNPAQAALAGSHDVFVSKLSDSPATTVCLRALEVNQSVQTWRNTIQLVKDKDTGVRAFVETAVAGAPNQFVNGLLHGTRGGSPLPGSPLANLTPGGTVIVQPGIVTRRGALGDSFNFQLPLSWQNGTIVLRFETPGTPLECQEPITPLAAPFSQDATGDCGLPVTFVQRNRPKVVVVSVPYMDGGPTQTPTTAERIEQMLRTITMFPTDTIQFQLDSIAALPSRPEPKDVNILLQKKHALDTSATCVSNCRTADFRYYGVMTGLPPGSALGRRDGVAASGYIRNVGARTAGGFGRTTSAHELGHAYGRGHAVDDTVPLSPEGWKQGQCGEQAGPAVPAHTPFELVGGNRRPVLGTLSAGTDNEVWGLDTRFLSEPAVNLAVIDPRQVFELMSYCNGGQPPENWISKYTYEGMYGAFPAGAADSSSDGIASTTVTGDFVLVSGSVDLLIDQATLDPATTASGTFNVPVTGAYRAQLLDGSGTELAGANFEPNESGEPSPRLFLVPLPQPAAPVAEIAILHNGLEIASAPASANAPTASIVAPTSGQSFSGPTVTFDWNASDLDGGPVTSNVLYSPDGGISWNAVAIDHAATELTVPRSALTASTNARLRVVVSDGVRTASADSAQFTVANNAPVTSITDPQDGEQFTPQQTITLEGLALDREDGSLDASIAWSSNRNGPLGTGSSISVLADNLATGAHVITATATDAASASGTATVTIEVAGPTGVTLRSFSAARSRTGVVLRWRTASEVGIAGFNVYRGPVRINRTLVRAKGGTSGASYRFVDRLAPSTAARYRLQAISLDGKRAWAGRARVSRR